MTAIENDRLAKRLRKYRKLGGLTQKDVAAKANVSYSYYSALENGVYNPSMSVLKRLSKVLSVSIDELTS